VASFTTTGTGDTEIKTSASGNTEIAAKFTAAAGYSLKRVVIPLKTNGAPSGAATLTCKIYNDSSGPSTAIGTSDTVLVSALDDEYMSITFQFATPVDLTAEAVYYVAIAASYTASADDNVMWRTGTVGSGGNAFTKDASAWSAVETNNYEFIANGYNFSAVTGATFTTATGAATTQRLKIDSDPLNIVRASATQGAGSTFVYGVCALTQQEDGATA
jgi:hypothetical protein